MAEIVVKLVNGELAGKTAQSIAKEVNAAALALKKAEVGTQAWVDSHKKLEAAKQLQSDLKKQMDATSSASNTLRSSLSGVLGQIPGFNQLSGSMGQLSGGVGGLTSASKILRTAMMAIPIFLLIGAITTLVGWFTKTERGGDLLAKGLAMAGAAIDVLRDRALKLVDALIAFVKGDWTAAAKAFGEATSGVVDEIVRETKAAGELADALDRLEELEGKLILVRSRYKEQIAELRLLQKDETLSFEQRANAMKRAIALQRDLNEQELKAKQGRVLQALQLKDVDEIYKKYGVTLDELLLKGEEILSVDNLGLGESTQEDLNKAFEALAAYNDQVASSNDSIRGMLKEYNSMNRKDRAEDTKDIKDNSDAQANIRKLANEKALNDIDDQRLKEIEKIRQETAEKIIALKGSKEQIAEQKKLLLEIENQDINAINKKYYDEEAAEALKFVEEEINAYRDALKKKEDELKAHQERVKQLEADAKQQIPQQIAATASVLAQAYVSDANLAIQQAERKVASLKEKYGEESQIYLQAQGQLDKFRKEQGEKIKRAEKTAVQINLIAEISTIWRKAAEFGPFQSVVAALQTVASLARANAAINQINAKQFGLGGIPSGVLRGPSHAQGGIPLVAEGEEIIMTKGVYRNPFLRNAASAINVMGGGRSFSAGGPTNPYDVRTAMSNSSPGGGDPFSSLLRLENTFKSYADKVDNWQREFRVTNNLQDTQKGLKTLQTLQSEWDV